MEKLCGNIDKGIIDMSQFVYFLLIPCADDVRLLMTISEGEWQLPYVVSDIHYSECAHFLIKHLKETYNIEDSILGLLDFLYYEKADTFSFFYLFDNHSDIASDQQAVKYFSKEDIEALNMKDINQFAMIEKWVREKKLIRSSPLRPVWLQRGWLSSVKSWIECQLSLNGIKTMMSIEPVKLWYRGYVMRIITDQGLFYFKAITNSFKIENLMLRDFSLQFPQHSPVIIAKDIDKGWVITKNIKGKDLMDIPDEELWTKAVRTYAQIQIYYTSEVEKLIQMGCCDRSIIKMPEMLHSISTEGLCLQSDLFGALNADEINTFRSLEAKILNDCARLEKYGIPTSLEHGDLTARNIKANGEKVTFFDWSDCSVSHPFFSMRALFGMLEVTFPDNNIIRNQLRNAYLKEWTNHGYGNFETITDAFELADKLAPLHMSMTYHFQILPFIERKEECIGTESLFIRWLLKQYSEGHE